MLRNKLEIFCRLSLEQKLRSIFNQPFYENPKNSTVAFSVFFLKRL